MLSWVFKPIGNYFVFAIFHFILGGKYVGEISIFPSMYTVIYEEWNEVEKDTDFDKLNYEKRMNIQQNRGEI